MSILLTITEGTDRARRDHARTLWGLVKLPAGKLRERLLQLKLVIELLLVLYAIRINKLSCCLPR